MSNSKQSVRRATALARKGRTLDALVVVLRTDITVDGDTHYVGLNRSDARHVARDILAKRKTIAFMTVEDSKGNEHSVPIVRTVTT